MKFLTNLSCCPGSSMPNHNSLLAAGDDVPTHFLINKWYNTRRIVLPLVVENDVEIWLFSGINGLETRPPFGVLEPGYRTPIGIVEIELVVVPDAAFDP